MMPYKVLFSLSLLAITVSSFSQNSKPDSYTFGEGLKFKSKEGHEVKLTSYLQPSFESRSLQDGESEAENRYRIRRARLRLDGNSANQKLSYRFQFDLAGSGEFEEQEGFYLLDAVVDYQLFKQIQISFGQRATYTDNRELFMLSNTLQFVERSRVTSAFASIREFGLFINGDFKTGGASRLRPYFLVTNGDGPNTFNNDFGGLKIGGRVDFLPFGLFSNLGQFRQVDIMRELTPKLVIGVNYSHNSGMSSRRGRTSGEILYLNNLNQITLPDYTKFGVDFLFKYKGFSALGEFVKAVATVPDDINQRIRVDGSIANTFLVNGIQDVENYVKGRMMLGEGYNIQMGYLFKAGYSVDVRYTHLKADENSFLNNPTFYNRPNYYTFGVSRYLSRNYGMKIQADITYVEGENVNDITTNPTRANEWISRIMVTFSL